jgi:hypothetical protein
MKKGRLNDESFAKRESRSWKMDQETREEIVLHALRWTNNILVEVLMNYGPKLPPEARVRLRDAISAVNDTDTEIRFPKLQELTEEAQEQGHHKETTNPLRKQ